MGTNTVLIVLAEPFGLDGREDVLARFRFKGGAKKFCWGLLQVGGQVPKLRFNRALSIVSVRGNLMVPSPSRPGPHRAMVGSCAEHQAAQQMADLGMLGKPARIQFKQRGCRVPFVRFALGLAQLSRQPVEFPAVVTSRPIAAWQHALPQAAHRTPWPDSVQPRYVGRLNVRRAQLAVFGLQEPDRLSQQQDRRGHGHLYRARRVGIRPTFLATDVPSLHTCRRPRHGPAEAQDGIG